MVKYFPVEMMAKCVMETRANRNIMKACALHPAIEYGHPFLKCAAMENGRAIEQERKSLTAMLRTRKLDDGRRVIFLTIVRITKTLSNIPNEQITNSKTTKTVFQLPIAPMVCNVCLIIFVGEKCLRNRTSGFLFD